MTFSVGRIRVDDSADGVVGHVPEGAARHPLEGGAVTFAFFVIPAEAVPWFVLASAELPPCGRATFLCWHKEKSPKESALGRQKRVGG